MSPPVRLLKTVRLLETLEYVDFEIAALLPSPNSRMKKRANFKTNIHLDFVESFLYYLISRFVSRVCYK